jgi:Peptidase family M23
MLALLIAAVLVTFEPGVVAHAADTTSTPIVAVVPTKSGSGYWEVTAQGAVYSYGDAIYHGGANTLKLNQSVVGAARTPTGGGYWLVAADGGVFAYGDAGFYGSAATLNLVQPVVGMAATATGKGYWLVASDGGIFAYGDAGFYGSATNLTLNQPIVGMAATATGKGYWLVAADGGVFAYGDAGFYGSAATLKLAQPVVGMAATATGKGYWLVASDGGIFAYGDAGFYGRVTYTPPAASGYRYILPQGAAQSSLTAPHHDYPALDISVVTGTPYYAITGGRVLRTGRDSSCGLGIILYGNDGAEYTFCHGSRWDVASGQTVAPGQQLGLTGNTGRSEGPHLHIQIKYPGTVLRCPQRLVSALATNAPLPLVKDLPTSGCFY